MHRTPFRSIVALAALAVAASASASITLYDHENFRGSVLSIDRPMVRDLDRYGFRDRTSSLTIPAGERWEICDQPRLEGRCYVLRPGRYPTPASLGMNDRVASLRQVPRGERIADDRYLPLPDPMHLAHVTFYEYEGFRGRSFTTDDAEPDFRRYGFNDQASSAVVTGAPVEACDSIGFAGRCMVLRPGEYPSLASMGLDNRVSSVRLIDHDAGHDEGRYEPLPVAGDYRRRPHERLYEVPVTYVHAVVNGPEQRCWVERQQVGQERGEPSVGGAIVGAVIGGVLGHQVGGGTGKSVATAGGVIAGAAIGSQVGRDANGQPIYRDVQQCARVPAHSNVSYYDVAYSFRGVEHRVQLTDPPGSTITVSAQGEPRA